MTSKTRQVRFEPQHTAKTGLYLSFNFYLLWVAIAVIAALGIVWTPFVYISLLLLLLLLSIAAFEYFKIIALKNKIQVKRDHKKRLSLGDQNEIQVEINNLSSQSLVAELIDEIPVVFQLRSFKKIIKLDPLQKYIVKYSLKPKERGKYPFGKTILYLSTGAKLVQVRLNFDTDIVVPVYPSVLQMNQQAIRIKKLERSSGSRLKRRQQGRSYEFDQIKNYVAGDDYRVLNWKATARSNKLMINTYAEERSQKVIAIIDTSRCMLSPFDGLRLIDYAVNSALALLNAGLLKGDKIGLLGFDKKVHTVIPASNRQGYLAKLLEVLYKQDPTDFEPDFDTLYQVTKRSVSGRSLLLLYTNIETMVSLNRNLKALKQLAKMHVLIVVNFINDKVDEEIKNPPKNLKQSYLNTIALEHDAQHQQIIASLKMAGIHVIRTAPQNLTVQVINKYLEVKQAGLL